MVGKKTSVGQWNYRARSLYISHSMLGDNSASFLTFFVVAFTESGK